MLTDEGVEDRIRAHFAESLEPPGDLVERVLHRHRRRQARLALWGAAPVVLLAGVLAAVLATTASPRGGQPARPSSPVRSAPTLRLGTYRFQLPEDYRLTSSVRTGCRAIVTMGVPRGTRAQASGTTAAPVYSTGTIASAVARAGGCITMLLSPSFTPTATSVPYLRTRGVSPGVPVRVGTDTGWLSTQSSVTSWLAARGVIQGSLTPPELQLSVEIPQAGGQERLLDVGSLGIAQATLVRIVARGLTS